MSFISRQQEFLFWTGYPNHSWNCSFGICKSGWRFCTRTRLRLCAFWNLHLDFSDRSFYQHSLERIEAIENDEIDQQRGGTESVFAGEREPSQAAARRLKFMNQWFMPIVSLLMVIVLATIAYFTLAWLRRLDDTSGNAVTLESETILDGN